MKLSVIIPVYNEHQTIREVIDKVQSVDLEKEIIVVDDGSTDGTADLLDGHHGSNLQVIHLPVNSGKGSAVREGLRHVQGDVVVIQDADLELDPEEYHRMLEPIRQGANVVYGSRFKGSPANMRRGTRLVNRAITHIFNVLFGCQLTDMETAYKMFRTEVILATPLTAERFEFEPEVTAKLLRRGEIIVEVPIGYAPRTRDEGKKIGWRDGLQALLTMLRWRFLA
ncbi:MAG TPA: glycosyltransferase family 2 protein [Chloroflexota bacterium]|nr:glycosyltransferase family 2 protein [Chloroflexota bacterium]